MANPQQVYSISISARITMELHSLNNEGGEGNQIATRMVTVVTPQGSIETVNAVSGDMLKHIQAAHLHRLAVEQGLPLGEGSRMFNPNRINIDVKANSATLNKKDFNDPAMLDWMLIRDAVSDMEGILITEGNRALGRKSVVEFGWLVGLPEMVRTDNYLHTKYVPNTGKGQGRENDATEGASTSEQSSGSNLGQNLFYRPASSGVYALVLNLEPARIGFNDINQNYAIDEAERTRRYQALLESVLYTLVQPRGAMRNTQNPHIVACEGVLTYSTRVIPAPTVSPLNQEYRSEVEGVANAMNKMSERGGIESREFNNLGELGEAISELRNMQPYRIQLPAAPSK